MNGDPSVSITKETITRLIKDVKEIIKNPLDSHGIYYKHDDEDLLKGKALIIGPQGTPYENGFYLKLYTLQIILIRRQNLSIKQMMESPGLIRICINAERSVYRCLTLGKGNNGRLVRPSRRFY
jgi:hypothetical protein